MINQSNQEKSKLQCQNQESEDGNALVTAEVSGTDSTCQTEK